MRGLRMRRLPHLAVVILVAACGSAPATPTPAATPTATLAPATPDLSSPTASATSEPEPSATATPAILTLGGTWVRPEARAKVTSSSLVLAAHPTAAGPGVTTVTEVAFLATWAGGERRSLCSAIRPAPNGTWTCKVNLLRLGVPPGRVTLSFDVHGVGVPTATEPDGPRRITYAVPPPRPTATSLEQVEQPDYDGGDNSAVLHRVHWSAPDGYADEFLVYETFECPRPSTERTNGKPCFIPGTPVDTTQLELRARAPGDARAVDVRLTEYECGPPHGTILLRARNAYGGSTFAIVSSAPVIWVAPGDIYC